MSGDFGVGVAVAEAGEDVVFALAQGDFVDVLAALGPGGGSPLCRTRAAPATLSGREEASPSTVYGARLLSGFGG